MFLLSTVVVLTLFSRMSISVDLDPISCDFDENFCGYTPTHPTFSESWVVNNGTVRESRVLDGPTSGVEASNGFLQLVKRKGILESPETRLSGQMCFSIDYFFLGVARTSLHLTATPTSEPSTGFRFDELSNNTLLLFSRNPASSKLDGWQHHQKTVNFRDDIYRITINASSLSELYKNIALDNLKFTEGRCAETEDQVCDFDSVVNSGDPDSPHCDWITILNSPNASEEANLKVAVDDRRIGFETDGDHSTASKLGGFLYVNGSRNQATIQTKTFRPEDGRHCLSFYTVSYGRPSYGFQVVERAIESGVENLLLEHTPESQFYIGWTKKSFDIDPVVDLNIEIRVTAGIFMLDSLTLSKGKCNPQYCDLSKDLCSWNVWNSINQPGRVYIGRGRIQQPSGEIEIHDMDYPNRYLYAEFSGSDHEDEVQLSTVVFTTGGDFCFRYVYKKENYPHGTQLWVQLDGVQPTYLPKQRDGNWSVGLVNIKATRNFVIKLDIRRHWRDGVRVKTVKIRETALLEGFCGQPPIRPRFGLVNFHCHQTGHFIPQYRSCDGVIDCPMGEDEDEHCAGGPDCANGGIPCRRRGHKFCMEDTDQFCNGVKDCDDESDEDPRMCNAESFCENYCLNGECRFSSFTCDCRESFTGKRCAQ